MSTALDTATVRQHLIDPEICIRCNTCEATCPVGAVTHDSRNYVVDVDKCNFCMACVPPCPTGSIDNWRVMPRVRAYTLEDQLGWDELPAELPAVDVEAGASVGPEPRGAAPAPAVEEDQPSSPAATVFGGSESATVPPWSAAHPYTNLYGPRAPVKAVTARVVGNHRVTDAGTNYDTHHIVLDFGTMPFPVLEGQSVGIVPPGLDAHGRPHHPRQYSIASPRDGERAGYNNVSLTVKRVLEDHAGQPVRGVASNYLCNLAVGQTVEVVGPFGTTFLMPNHPGSHLVMICTGTGSAPMRAMTERRRRESKDNAADQGRLILFFGARTQRELPYFGPLQNLPRDFIDIHLAYSRTPGQPRTHVQDLMREQASLLSGLLADPEAYFYVCGLKAMERGVLDALRDIATGAGMDWTTLSARLRHEGRLHLETY